MLVQGLRDTAIHTLQTSETENSLTLSLYKALCRSPSIYLPQPRWTRISLLRSGAEENSVWLMTGGLSPSLWGQGGVAKKWKGCAWEGEKPAEWKTNRGPQLWVFTYLANLRKPALLKSLIPFACYFMWEPRKTSGKRLGFFPVSFRVNSRVISGNPCSLPSSTFSLCYV